jgi:hypothetical protein
MFMISFSDSGKPFQSSQMFVGKATSLPEICFTWVGFAFTPKLCHNTQNDFLHNNSQHNDNQRNGTQNNETQHNDTQHNDTQHNDTQHNDM